MLVGTSGLVGRDLVFLCLVCCVLMMCLGISMSEHGHVCWGWAGSCLSVSCLICLHGVSVCHNFDGVLFLTSSTYRFRTERRTEICIAVITVIRHSKGKETTFCARCLMTFPIVRCSCRATLDSFFSLSAKSLNRPDIKQNLIEIEFTESAQIQPARGDGSFGSTVIKSVVRSGFA